MAWLMLVVLATGTVYGPLYHTRAACWKASQMFEALDPEIVDTQCVKYESRTPGNIA